MKKIAIVANRISLGEHILSDIEAYFGEYASFRLYSLEEIQASKVFEEDAVVLSSWRIFDKVRTKLASHTAVEVISLTLSKENLKRMEPLGEIKKAYLVNYDYRGCMQVITQFYELGYEEIEFIPYWGTGAPVDPAVQIAITPNEAQLAPPGIPVCNLGERAVEPHCILRLATKLGIDGIFDSPRAEAAKNKVALPLWGLDSLLWENTNAKNNIRAVIEYIEDGILICDKDGNCYIGNEKVKELLELDSIDGLNVREYVSQEVLQDVGADTKTVVSVVDGKKLIFSVTAVVSEKGRNGNLVVVRNFEESEERQHHLRNKVAGEKHEARYTFADIQGDSPAIREVIELARRMAQSTSSVMIMGESGTGKEVLAQSMHNASPRKNYSFVALNCAAIPENLLESELFGYEEGAFTGAKKGGKIGYFELAHKGTIFLDEIGELPMSLQGKLLRVIEERKVARIGSSRLVDIDVRIISATNRDLRQLVDEKLFREDLYYRINVLPIYLPSMNERGEDILALFDYFRQKMGGAWTYNHSVKERLLRHKWQGNAREIRNVVEYLDNLGKASVEVEDLPKGFWPSAGRGVTEMAGRGVSPSAGCGATEIAGPGAPDGKQARDFILRTGQDIALHVSVLEALSHFRQQKRSAGRTQIQCYLEENGLDYTAAEIRKSLRCLSESGYVRTLKGRGGSKILPEGEALLTGLKGFVG